MSYRDSPSWFQAWAHRSGVSRRLNCVHGDSGWTSSYVETVLPFVWLARVSVRTETRQPRERRRVGRLCWRWTFVPDPPRRFR